MFMLHLVEFNRVFYAVMGCWGFFQYKAGKDSFLRQFIVKKYRFVEVVIRYSGEENECQKRNTKKP